MKCIEGIWLPDEDQHFEFHLCQGPRFQDAGTYQMRKITAALNIVPKNRRKLAIDVGAHVGLWSRVLASEFERVVAFEPMPHLRECFARNLEGRENVTLDERAVGAKAGRLHLGVVPDNSGNCRVIDSDPEAFKVRINVPVVDLDLCAIDDVSFIKIDVEGWEYAVVTGAEDTIRKHKPVIVVEQKPGHARRYGVADDAAVQELKKWGMEIVWIKAGDYCLRWPDA
jgi:FkbM family methyltransferase